MASLPLPILHHPAQDESAGPATDEERQPLVDETEDAPDTPTADAPTIEEMGIKDTYEKKEGRQGDYAAQIAAFVRIERMNLWIILTSCQASAVVFVTTIWIMALSSPSLFSWHPICQSFALALFTYGTLISFDSPVSGAEFIFACRNLDASAYISTQVKGGWSPQAPTCNACSCDTRRFLRHFCHHLQQISEQ